MCFHGHVLVFSLGPHIIGEFLELDEAIKSNVRYYIEDKHEEYIIYAELPGVRKDSIEVYVAPHGLLVKAKPSTKLPWMPGVYRLKVKFGSEVDREGTKAKYKDGILIINVPKKSKAVKIQVE